MKKLILLRGLVRESRHWGSFKDNLNNELKDHQVLTPEIQGVGKYHEQISPDNLKEMIHFMREQIKDDLTEDSVLVSMSLGGMIAKQWTELYPNDFKKLILINTSFKGINPLFSRLRPNALLNFINIFLTPHTALREQKILELVSNEQVKRESILPLWINIQKEAPVKRKSFINQIKAALTFEPSLDKPNIDTLILASKADRLCKYSCSVKLSALWDCKLKLHQSAGHDIPLDAPEWLIAQIKEFIHE